MADKEILDAVAYSEAEGIARRIAIRALEIRIEGLKLAEQIDNVTEQCERCGHVPKRVTEDDKDKEGESK